MTHVDRFTPGRGACLANAANGRRFVFATKTPFLCPHFAIVQQELMAALAKALPVHSSSTAISTELLFAIPKLFRSWDTMPPLEYVAIHAKLRLEDESLFA